MKSARHARHPRNKSRGCRVCRACPRGRYDKLFPWNYGFTAPAVTAGRLSATVSTPGSAVPTRRPWRERSPAAVAVGGRCASARPEWTRAHHAPSPVQLHHHQHQQQQQQPTSTLHHRHHQLAARSIPGCRLVARGKPAARRQLTVSPRRHWHATDAAAAAGADSRPSSRQQPATAAAASSSPSYDWPWASPGPTA